MAELVIPNYLNEALFRKSIEGALECSEGLVIKNFNITAATSSGDNYLSDVFRIRVEYSTWANKHKAETMSLIIKCMPETEFRGAFITDLKAYEKETDMFLNVLPELSAVVGDTFAAKCFYATRDPIKIIAFQDLKSLNFQMADRMAGIDYSHCELILKKIGKFHAASMVYAEKNPEKIRSFNTGMYNPQGTNTSTILNMFTKGLKTLTNVADTKWPAFDREIVAKLRRLQSVFVDKLTECLYQNNDHGVNVLNHGDLWINNMMFSYENDSNVPSDLVFVDYQISFYTSPGLDLNYFINTCPTHEVRESRQDDMIRTYYESLKGSLEHLKYGKIPKYEEILMEFQKMHFWGFVAAVFILPFVSLEKNDKVAQNFDGLANEESSTALYELAYNGKNYHKNIRPILERYNKLKLFDDL